MPPTIIYILIGIAAFVVLFIFYFVLIGIISKNRIKKMYLKTNECLKKYCDKYDYRSFEIQTGKPYDYILKTKKKIDDEIKDMNYYIKLIPNFANEEITINNAVKWQLRRDFNDNSLRYVDNIEEFMRLDLPLYEEGRLVSKIFLVYPNAKSLLMYINECEMKFVKYDTDVYSTTVITYLNLLENGDSIL